VKRTYFAFILICRGERLLLSLREEGTLREDCDFQSWIEEAMVEIAIENEVNDECRELSLAMEVRTT